jgi:hypothetical protein
MIEIAEGGVFGIDPVIGFIILQFCIPCLDECKNNPYSVKKDAVMFPEKRVHVYSRK